MGLSRTQIIGRYRELTGEVPLFGRWAYGFWQCKNKYESQQEIETVAAQAIAPQHIPVDNIVQDWFWWITMGEMKWNPNYPDPQAMIDTLHDEHFHLMVSIWPYFRPGSATYDEFDKNGWFIAKTIQPSFHPVGQALYDATNLLRANSTGPTPTLRCFKKAWTHGGSTPMSRRRKAAKTTS